MSYEENEVLRIRLQTFLAIIGQELTKNVTCFAAALTTKNIFLNIDARAYTKKLTASPFTRFEESKSHFRFLFSRAILNFSTPYAHQGRTLSLFVYGGFPVTLHCCCALFQHCATYIITALYAPSGNTKRGSITVLLTSCLTGLESAV